MLSSLKARIGGFIGVPEKRALLENLIFLSALQGINYILPLVTVPYLVRVLGPEKFGLVAFAGAIVQYLTIFTDYGFNLSATRKISIHREDQQKVSDIFAAVFFAKIGLMLISFLILIALLLTIPRFSVEWPIYLFAFGTVVGTVLFPVWFFQGMEKMKYITFLNLLARGIFTAAIFVFVRQQGDYAYVPLINSLGLVTAGLISLWIVQKDFGVRPRCPSLTSLTGELKDGWHVFLTTMATSLYTTSNIVFLGLLTNNTIVGFYAAAERLIRALQGLLTPVSQAVYPYISKLASESRQAAFQFIKKTLKLVGSMILLICLIVFLFAAPIVSIVFGNGYEESIIVLKLLAFLPFIIALSNIFAIQGLYGFGLYKIVSKYVVICSLLYVPALITLTRFFQHIGTAISAVVIEIAITGFSVYYFAVKYRGESVRVDI